MNRNFFPALIVLLNCSLFCVSSLVHAQQPWLYAPLNADRQADRIGLASQPKLVYLLQGERRKIARDFVARLDGDRLRVSLEDRGLVSTSPDRELIVSLIQSSGQRVDLQPDADGEVVFDGVRAGFAALIVTANRLSDISFTSLYAAIPVFVVAAEDEALAAGDVLRAPLAQVDPTSLVENIDREVVPQGAAADISDLREFELLEFSRFRVQRMADGSVEGRIVVPQNGFLAVPGVTLVSFEQDGSVIATAVSDEEGFFVAENVPLGTLSLIATGAAGHAAYAVEVVEFQGVKAPRGDTQSSKRRSQVRFVSRQEAVGRRLLVLLIPPALMDEVLRLLRERFGGWLPDGAVAGESSPVFPLAEEGSGSSTGGLAAGGYPGGGFGGAGGGGAFVGGGAGGALGIAALATAIAALSNDDDGFSSNISTPIAPTFVP